MWDDFLESDFLRRVIASDSLSFSNWISLIRCATLSIILFVVMLRSILFG